MISIPRVPLSLICSPFLNRLMEQLGRKALVNLSDSTVLLFLGKRRFYRSTTGSLKILAVRVRADHMTIARSSIARMVCQTALFWKR